MIQLVKRLWPDEQAEGLFEYALLLLLISMTAVSTVGSLASTVSNYYSVASMSIARAEQGGSLSGASLRYQVQDSSGAADYSTGKKN